MNASLGRDNGGSPENGGTRSQRPVLITGGAGFIGTNVAASYLNEGRRVIIFDNLSRRGVEENLRWLTGTFPSLVEVEEEDVRNVIAVERAVERASCVFHFAAQVAVTTSLVKPRLDFAVNAAGTLNVLEACRRLAAPPPLLFTSTNKVYGSLDDLPLVRKGRQYVPAEERVRRQGIDERQPLDFHSPYGCSKGTADQYVRDYAKCFGLPTVVFRMSCIYGPHQHGTEDQGWAAHFVRQLIQGRPITIYGDGRQVRDMLFIKDLVRAMRLAIERIDLTRGETFNMGGGPANAVSVREVVEVLSQLHPQSSAVRRAEWRIGDQRYYVSNINRFQRLTGWAPTVSVRKGLAMLNMWMCERDGRAAGSTTADFLAAGNGRPRTRQGTSVAARS